MAIRQLLVWACVSAMLVCAGCCQPKPVEVGYESNLLQSQDKPAVEVQVIGFNSPANLDRFGNCSLNDYFDPSKTNSLRDDMNATRLVKVLHFSNSTPGNSTAESTPPVQVIAPDDDVYKAWISSKVTDLVIVQNFPRTNSEQKSASADTRYLHVPFDCSKWDGPALIIRIGASGPTCETAVTAGK